MSRLSDVAFYTVQPYVRNVSFLILFSIIISSEIYGNQKKSKALRFGVFSEALGEVQFLQAVEVLGLCLLVGTRRHLTEKLGRAPQKSDPGGRKPITPTIKPT